MLRALLSAVGEEHSRAPLTRSVMPGCVKRRAQPQTSKTKPKSQTEGSAPQPLAIQHFTLRYTILRFYRQSSPRASVNCRSFFFLSIRRKKPEAEPTRPLFAECLALRVCLWFLRARAGSACSGGARGISSVLPLARNIVSVSAPQSKAASAAGIQTTFICGGFSLKSGLQ